VRAPCFSSGVAVMSCMVAAPRAHGSELITVEGLARDDQLHRCSKRSSKKAAVQCGYCTPGFLDGGRQAAGRKTLTFALGD